MTYCSYCSRPSSSLAKVKVVEKNYPRKRRTLELCPECVIKDPAAWRMTYHVMAIDEMSRY